MTPFLCLKKKKKKKGVLICMKKALKHIYFGESEWLVEN